MVDCCPHCLDVVPAAGLACSFCLGDKCECDDCMLPGRYVRVVPSPWALDALGVRD